MYSERFERDYLSEDDFLGDEDEYRHGVRVTLPVKDRWEDDGVGVPLDFALLEVSSASLLNLAFPSFESPFHLNKYSTSVQSRNRNRNDNQLELNTYMLVPVLSAITNRCQENIRKLYGNISIHWTGGISFPY